jgi:hypothetical protein
MEVKDSFEYNRFKQSILLLLKSVNECSSLETLPKGDFWQLKGVKMVKQEVF